MRRTKYSILLFVITIVFFSGAFSNACASPSVKTNLQLLEDVLDSTLQVLEHHHLIDNHDTLFVRVLAEDTMFRQVQRSFIHERLLDNYDAVLISDSAKYSDKGKMIIFRWLNWQIQYVPIKSPILWGKSLFQRNLTADYFVEVISSLNNQILFSRRMQMNVHDRINNKDMKKLQRSRYSFAKGVLEQEKSFFSRWLKPIILFAISGTVVYLFYSVRTQ